VFKEVSGLTKIAQALGGVKCVEFLCKEPGIWLRILQIAKIKQTFNVSNDYRSSKVGS
jgi:hypothetical protein